VNKSSRRYFSTSRRRWPRRDPAKYPYRKIILTAGGTGGVLCEAISDGTNWRQVAIGINAI